MSDPTVLIVDDERNLVRSLSYSLTEEGLTVHTAGTGAEGLEAVDRHGPDVMLLDLRLPDMSGLEVLDQLALLPDPPVTLMISAHGDTRAAVDAVKRGAHDYITKPFDLDELVLLIRRHYDHARLNREVHYLRDRQVPAHGLIGESAVMVDLRGRIDRIGGSSARTVLLLGPSGGGKTLVAKALHNVKHRDAPFVSINCASLPESLLEAELFGAEKGAYTGADRKRTGLVALADGGTLFLDEIGELPLALQAKFLTFLETHSYRPVGAGEERKADIRVIAATNRDILREVDAGTFRQDLYYRLNVMPLTVPPLRDRDGDATVLSLHFIAELARQEGCAPIRLADGVLERFNAYDWPGNVRELRNIIERLTILYPGQTITPGHLPAEFRERPGRGAVPSPAPMADARSSLTPAAAGMVGEGGDGLEEDEDLGHSLSAEVLEKERQYILQALARTNGRKGLAAEWLGISRHALKRRMQKHKIGDYG